jgi:hypothetical protein
VRTESRAKDRERVRRAGGAWDSRGEERRTNTRHVERGRTSQRRNNVGVAHAGEQLRSRGDADLADGNREAHEQRSSSRKNGAGEHEQRRHARRKNTKREGARGPERQRGRVRGLAEARETEERRCLEKEIARGAQGQHEVGAEDRDIDMRPGSSSAVDDRQRREGGERS